MAETVAGLDGTAFDAIATDLPGEWSTDGEWTIAVRTRPVHGGPMNDDCHRVLVYEAPPERIGIDTDLAARTTAMSRAAAIRRALDQAGYPAVDAR